jgi:hypothetical protein
MRRGRERVKEGQRASLGSREVSGVNSASTLTQGRAGHIAARPSHGGGALLAWRPSGQNDEHLAGDRGGEVGCVPGLAPGQIWTWAQNEVCSPQPAIHFSFKDQDH